MAAKAQGALGMNVGDLTIEIRAETTIFQIQLRCVQDLLKAETPLDVLIATRALSYLSEILHMADAARIELGVRVPERVEIGVRFQPHRPGAAWSI